MLISPVRNKISTRKIGNLSEMLLIRSDEIQFISGHIQKYEADISV